MLSQQSKLAYLAVAASLSALVLAANTPLPLLVVYQEAWGFSTGALSVIYGIYTLGVITAVFILGPASDLVGRKRVLLPAGLIMIAGLLLGMFAASITALMVSRVLQGIAVGAGVTTAVATLGDLRPSPESHSAVALTATVATVIGLAGGPLVAGSLAQFAPFPTVTPYLAALLVLTMSFGTILFVPETVARRAAFQFQTIRVSIPREEAYAFGLAIFVEMTAYAVAGTFAGFGPSFARDLLGLPNRFYGGLVVGALFVSSALTQISARKTQVRTAMIAGLLVLVAGLALFLLGVMNRSAATFLASAVVLGGGHGLAYLGAQELTDRIAPLARRAQIFSGFQLGLYVGATVPALAVGFVSARIGLSTATIAFAACIGALSLFGAVLLRNANIAVLRR